MKGGGYMWNKKKEELFIKELSTRRQHLVDSIEFIETQLIEYAAFIDFDVEQYKHFNETELLDFFEWYLDEGLDGAMEVEICIAVVNFLYLTIFDVFMFSEDEE